MVLQGTFVHFFFFVKPCSVLQAKGELGHFHNHTAGSVPHLVQYWVVVHTGSSSRGTTSTACKEIVNILYFFIVVFILLCTCVVRSVCECVHVSKSKSVNTPSCGKSLCSKFSSVPVFLKRCFSFSSCAVQIECQ